MCQWLRHAQLVSMQPGKREEEEEIEKREESEEEASDEEASEEEDSEEEEEGDEDSSEEEVQHVTPHPLQMPSLALHAQARTCPFS